MAQARTEVKPLVASMPTSGFQLQTGGSARRRIVKNESDSYRVTGVPGHTHNASAVLSVLCDHTRTRGRTFDLTNRFAWEDVRHYANDPGDSETFAEDTYDRALERGIGEIAVIPENCHQEIREPMRAIGEVRALVTAADRLKTLTYVDEVGGFVSLDGSAFVSAYPEVEVDLFSHRAEALAVENVQAADVGRDFDNKILFKSHNWERDANNIGYGTSLEVCLAPGSTTGLIATIGTVRWDGLVTFHWNQYERKYVAEPFTVKFAQLQEASAGALPDVVEHEDVIVGFPRLETQVAENGNCVFSAADATTQLASHEGAITRVWVDVQEALTNLQDHLGGYHLEVAPFRIPIGQQAIYGPVSTGVSYWDRLRATEVVGVMATIAQDYHDQDQLAFVGQSDLLDEQSMQEIQIPLTEEVRPLYGRRNAIPGTAWYPADVLPDVRSFNGQVDRDTGDRVNANDWAETAIPAAFEDELNDYNQAVGELEAAEQANDQNAADAAQAVIDGALDAIQQLPDIAVPDPAYPGDSFVLKEVSVEDVVPVAKTPQQFFDDIELGATLANGADAAWYSEEHYNDYVAQQDDALAANYAALADAQNDLAQAQTAQEVAGAEALIEVVEEAIAATQALVNGADDLFVVKEPRTWMKTPSSYTGRLSLKIRHADMEPGIEAGYITPERMASVPMRLLLGQTGNLRLFHIDGFDPNDQATWPGGIGLAATRDGYNAVGKMQYGGQPEAWTDGAGIRTCLFQLWTDVKAAGLLAGPGGPEWGYILHPPVDDLLNLDLVQQSSGQQQHEVVVLGLDAPQIGVQKFEAWKNMAYVGNFGFAKVCDFDEGQGEDPFHDALDADADQLFPDIKVLPPHLIYENAQDNNQNDLGEPAYDSSMYLVDCSMNFDKNRRIMLRFNDMQENNDDPRDLPSVAVFETDDCTPELWMSEDRRAVHLMTRVDNVRYLRRALETTSPLNWLPSEPKQLDVLNDHFWPRALGFPVPAGVDLVPADQAPSDDYDTFATRCGPNRENAETVTFLYMSSEYQDMFWDPLTSPFEARKDASTAIGPVFQSKIRVSQHLCAPLLNPNRRIGCSAPLNYDSQHLPPELRDFRIELRDVKWDFLPGVKTLENLIMYEFNGGNQQQEQEESLLHLPQFRQFNTSTTPENSFELEIFSPYGMPSYIAIYARDPDFERDAARQPVIKELNIQSGTTMKKSNSILEAREHELYHMTQRNVHPRAEYDRYRYRNRQVILLSAEDIGMLGLAEYQAQKRARYILRGSVDRAATVTALFIYNNRGLLVHGREISVVRV